MGRMREAGREEITDGGECESKRGEGKGRATLRGPEGKGRGEGCLIRRPTSMGVTKPKEGTSSAMPEGDDDELLLPYHVSDVMEPKPLQIGPAYAVAALMVKHGTGGNLLKLPAN